MGGGVRLFLLLQPPVWTEDGLYLHVGIGHVDDAVQVRLGCGGVSDEQVEGGAQQQGLGRVPAP